MNHRRTLIIAVISFALLGLIVVAVVAIRGGALGSSATVPDTSSPVAPSASSPATEPCAFSCGDSPQAAMEAVPPLVWDEPSKDAARQTAADFMAAFARPELSIQDWYAQIYPLTVPSYGKALFGTNPARVTASQVTGEAVLSVDPDNGFSVWATVPTDSGPWSVQLLRTDAAAPWLVLKAHPGEDHA